MNNLKTKLIFFFNTLFVMMAVGPMQVLAANDDLSWITNDSSGGELANLNDQARGYIADIYTLVSTVGIGVAVICGVMAAIKMTSNDSRKRNEGKDAIFYVLAGAALIGGMVSIISFAMKVGKSFQG